MLFNRWLLIFDTQPVQFNSYPKNHHLLGELSTNDKILRLIDISNGWYIISEKQGQLYFHDLRFGVLDSTASNPTFVFTYRLIEEEGEIIVEEVERNPEEAKNWSLYLQKGFLEIDKFLIKVNTYIFLVCKNI